MKRPAILPGMGAALWIALAPPSAAAVDDGRVDEVRIAGNRLEPTGQLLRELPLRAGGPLSRALVRESAARIVARYQARHVPVRVTADLTHPGEAQGAARTVLTFTLAEGAAPAGDDPPDPLEAYYGNTLVCAAAQSGEDLCHVWLERDGRLVIFDPGEAKAGHYTVGPLRADGKVPVCLYWDTPAMLTPAEIGPRGGPPPGPGALPAGPPSMLCRNSGFRTSCAMGVDAATLPEEDRALVGLTMGERFHRGMCYPLGPHEVGDTWYEADDPLPAQQGLDKMLLLRGHR